MMSQVDNEETHNLEVKTSTALWVINHADTHSITRSTVDTGDDQYQEGSSCMLKSSSFTHPNSSGNAFQVSRSPQIARPNDLDIKKSIDDLSSVASTQTRLRLQLKRAKIYSLLNFKANSKIPMHSSSESLNSESSSDSASISMTSSFISLPRPAFPAGITPTSSFSSQRSLKSPLNTFKPSPEFTRLASTVLKSLPNDGTDEMNHNNMKRSSVMKSQSGSTLLDTSPRHSTHSSTSTSSQSDELEDEVLTDKGVDMTSPQVRRKDNLHLLDNSALTSHSGALQQKTVRRKKRTGAHSKTHPPLTKSTEEEEQRKPSARDTNNFTSNARVASIETNEDVTNAQLSDDSMFASSENVCEDKTNTDSEFVKEVLAAVSKHMPLNSVNNQRSSRVNRQYKSEPFGNGESFPIIPEIGVTYSHSSPSISNRPTSLVSVKEDSPADEAAENMKDTPSNAADRKAIVNELIASEEKYVKNLDQITKAVKKMKDDEVLDESSVFTMFHNIRITDTAVHHMILLNQLKQVAVESKWDPETSAIGTIMCNTFQKESLHENYLQYVNNLKQTKELLRAQLARNNSFSKFNDRFKEQNRMDLKDAVSTPANRLSSYNMILERYLRCTPQSHPDYTKIQQAIRIVSNLLDTIGKIDNNSKQSSLKELEKILDLSELVVPDREFIRVDNIKLMGHKEDYGIWMFSDLILLTVNRTVNDRASRRKSTVVFGKHGQVVIPGSKRCYKMFKRVGLDDTEVLNSPESEVQKYKLDMENITIDLQSLKEVHTKLNTVYTPHERLSAELDHLIDSCEKKLKALERKSEMTNRSSLRLVLHTLDGGQEFTLLFKDPKVRSAWEQDLLSSKLNLETANWNKLPPQFLDRIPVDRTRAGMQFTCATTTLTCTNDKDIWFCNSDSTAGYLCRLRAKLKPPRKLEQVQLPGCKSRITCICSVAAHRLVIDEDVDNNSSASLRKDDSLDTRESLMWVGCEDGTLYLIRASKSEPLLETPHINMKCAASITAICNMEDKVFVSLNNKDILVYQRLPDGQWNLDSPRFLHLSIQTFVRQLLPVSQKLWCASNNEIVILDPVLEHAEKSIHLGVENSIQVMAYSRQGAVAVAMRSSCDIKLFHHGSLRQLGDVSVFSPVAQKLSNCDEIIKQHKTACLKITSLICCKHMLWIGTTAGVVCTLRLPKILSSDVTQKQFDMPPLVIDALDIGHTGNVRFLTFAELMSDMATEERKQSVARQSLVTRMLVVSGGDGYELIDPTHQAKDMIGFNDSINHLLLWTM